VAWNLSLEIVANHPNSGGTRSLLAEIVLELWAPGCDRLHSNRGAVRERNHDRLVEENTIA
jgi:hypothetical protein